MIHVSNLTKEYAGRVAVDDISFDVQPGEIVGFLGPNGAGKSTTMRILSGYMPPTSGLAMVGGHNVFEDSLAVRRLVGYMPESAPLYLDMRVKEYLHFRGALKGLSGKDLRVRTGEVMDICGLIDVRRRLIENLSKGYRQRVALADALIHRPPLLILDEPTNGLDPTQIRHVRELLRGLRPQHTVLLSTHILHEVELTCDRVIMIHHGRIKACDTPRNLTRGLRAAGTVYVELQGGKDIGKQLDDLPGVRKVVAEKADGPWQAYSLRIESNTDVREAIQELAMKQQWRIRELHRKLPTLEDVFIELAASDAPARLEDRAA
ncbi:MAG: type transport system ATP-binding protein [Verrucomicrobiaceae bacterium]|nr:type transport system ATP-binding protein [Verrucomicrobiaceae bacterium]